MRQINLVDTETGNVVREIPVADAPDRDFLEGFAKRAEEVYSEFYGRRLFAEIA